MKEIRVTLTRAEVMTAAAGRARWEHMERLAIAKSGCGPGFYLEMIRWVGLGVKDDELEAVLDEKHPSGPGVNEAKRGSE